MQHNTPCQNIGGECLSSTHPLLLPNIPTQCDAYPNAIIHFHHRSLTQNASHKDILGLINSVSKMFLIFIDSTLIQNLNNL